MGISSPMRIYISSVFYLFLPVFGTLAAADNFGLLYGTLKSFQAHACDGEELRLNCSGNTAIAVNYFFYGRREHSENLCVKSRLYAPIQPCQLNQALKVIENRCRSQVLCRLLISSDIFQEVEVDPCPHTSKYAEVIYKCRPESFRNKVVCEGESLHLSCPSNQRLAIYAATFGSTKSEIDECPQPTGRREECQASYATETVMRQCVGEQKCTVVANVSTFGSPHCAGRKHLKIAYSCVNGEILNTEFRGLTSEEEMIHTTLLPRMGTCCGPSIWRQQEANSAQTVHPFKSAPTEPSNLFKSEMQSDEVSSGDEQNKPTQNKQLVGFMSELMSARKYMEGNKHKLILYVSLSVAIGLIAFVSVLAARLYIIRMRSRKDNLPPAPEDPFFSDSDLEQFDPPDEPPVPTVSYSTLRRHDSDAQPRTPITAADDKYFS
ncbi:protein eva-1-like [Uloborus diversus]|uniref:protein eva-1-like n=1 Tax=Uloborus diversus TaxID=327109 RepID=UPI00240A6102|nr:protein eva-1-like [Uloborus diversus]